MWSPRTVVGVDGSTISSQALRWAAVESARREVELVVVHAFDWRVFGAPSMVGGAYAVDAREHAERLVAQAVAEARAHAPGVEARGEAVLGSAAAVLVTASSQADLVVVGSRGRGTGKSLLLGSVSHQVASQAHSSVVIVAGRPNACGPIVVGVDGSEGSLEALGLAYEQATRSSTGIVAVRVCRPPSSLWDSDGPSTAEDSDQRRNAELVLLNEDVQPWRDKFPQIATECVVMTGRAAAVLAGISENAEMMVVGTRGHGELVGVLLGSVSLRLLHHAGCPVLVARPQSADAS